MRMRRFHHILFFVCFFIFEFQASGLSKTAIEIPQKLQVLEGSKSFALSNQAYLQFAELGRTFSLSTVIQPVESGYSVQFQAAAISEDLNKVILLKADKKVSHEWLNQVFRHSKGFFVPVQLGSQQVSLLFLGFNEKEVIENLSAFQKLYANADSTVTSRPVISLIQGFWVLKAYASETAKPQSGESLSYPSSSPSSSSISRAEVEKYAYAFGESTWKCIQGGNDAFNAVAVDPFVSAGKGLKVLLNPNRSLKENWLILWNNTVVEWEALKKTLLNFESFAKEKYNNFVSLPNAEKSRLYCNFVASSVGGTAVSAKIVKLNKLSAKAVVPSQATVADDITVINYETQNPLAKTSQAGKKTSTDRGPPSPDEAVANLEKRIGKKLEVHVKEDKHMTKFGLIDPESATEVGYFSTIYKKESGVLKVGQMTTDDAYRKYPGQKAFGVGEIMMGLALKHFPDTKVISTGALIQTNEAVFKAALQKGMTREEAIKQTPAYKIRAKYGFTEIVPGSINDKYGFDVRKPTKPSH